MFFSSWSFDHLCNFIVMETGLSCVGRFWSLLSFLAASAASIGYFMPFWLQGIIRHDEGDFDTHLGVFRRCNYLIPLTDSVAKRPATIIVRECGRYTTFWDIPGVWWQTATVTIGVGCGLSILVAFSALLCCCVRDSMSKNLARMAGVIQLVSGKLFPYLRWKSLVKFQFAGEAALLFYFL